MTQPPVQTGTMIGWVTEADEVIFEPRPMPENGQLDFPIATKPIPRGFMAVFDGDRVVWRDDGPPTIIFAGVVLSVLTPEANERLREIQRQREEEKSRFGYECNCWDY